MKFSNFYKKAEDNDLVKSYFAKCFKQTAIKNLDPVIDSLIYELYQFKSSYELNYQNKKL